MSDRTRLAEALEDGQTLSLWERGGALEVEVDGRVAFASDRRGPDDAIAELATAPWAMRDDISVLLAGLGSGFLLRALLARPGVARVDVVEASPAVIAWEAQHFAVLNGGASGDARVRVHHGELAAFVQAARPDAPPDGWSILVVDTDAFPEHLARPGNAVFYSDEGLPLLEAPLRGGGVLVIPTTAKDDALYKRLHRRFQALNRLGAAGDDGLIYVHRARRGPKRAS
jgi:spermidine synthase